MLVDLHLPVMNSDAGMLLEALRGVVLDGVCLVDFRRLPAADLVARVRESGLKVFVGAQVPLAKGHVLVVPPDEAFDWDSFLSQAPEDQDLVGFARSKGCAIVACHPYDKDTEAAMGDRLLQYSGFDALISVTGSSPVSANDMVMDVFESVGAPAAGGTGEKGQAGKAATLFANPFDSQARLVEELRSGECWAVAVGDEDRWTVVERRSDGWGDQREGHRDGRRDGHRDGRRDGRRNGRRDGRRDGRQEGRRNGQRPVGDRPAGNRPDGNRDVDGNRIDGNDDVDGNRADPDGNRIDGNGMAGHGEGRSGGEGRRRRRRHRKPRTEAEGTPPQDNGPPAGSDPDVG